MSENDTQRENELICERLLGWERAPNIGTADGRAVWYRWRSDKNGTPTPTFRTGNDMLLIVKALLALGVTVEVSTARWPGGDERSGVHLTPFEPDRTRAIQLHGLAMPIETALRAAALAYLQATGEGR